MVNLTKILNGITREDIRALEFPRYAPPPEGYSPSFRGFLKFLTGERDPRSIYIPIKE